MNAVRAGSVSNNLYSSDGDRFLFCCKGGGRDGDVVVGGEDNGVGSRRSSFCSSGGGVGVADSDGGCRDEPTQTGRRNEYVLGLIAH